MFPRSPVLSHGDPVIHRITGQVGWGSGQPDLMAELAFGNTAHSRASQLGDLTGAFQPKGFCDSMRRAQVAPGEVQVER